MKKHLTKIALISIAIASLFFVLPQSVSAAVVLVQKTGVQGGLASSQTLAYSSNVVAGDILTAQVIKYRDTCHQQYSVTDSQGNIWTQDAEADDGAGTCAHPDYASTWRTVAGSSAADTITITNLDGTQYASLGIAEFSGANTVADVTSNLAGWWKLDEGSGTSAADSSGNSNTGTLNGTPSWAVTPEIGPAALLFDGNNRYVSTPALKSYISGAWTVSAWVKFATVPGSEKEYLGVYDSSGGTELEFGFDAAGSGKAFIYNGITGAFTSNTALTANHWHLITWVSSAGSPGLFVYLDGVLDRSTNASAIGWPAAAGSTGGATYLGACGFDCNNFNGGLDDVRIYSRALSAGEILQLYQRGLDLIAGVSANNTGTNASAGSITSDANGALYVGGMSHDSTNSNGASGSGFTDVYVNQLTINEPIYSEYMIQGTAGAQAINWTNDSRDWVAAGAAYRAAANAVVNLFNDTLRIAGGTLRVSGGTWRQ